MLLWRLGKLFKCSLSAPAESCVARLLQFHFFSCSLLALLLIFLILFVCVHVCVFVAFVGLFVVLFFFSPPGQVLHSKLLILIFWLLVR